jgi:geranylgeranyl pyrophosphate synthase
MSLAAYDNWLEPLKVDLLLEYQTLTRPYGLDAVATSLADGKFFRSFLAHLVAGPYSPGLRRRCVCLEMLHTSTLVHDDIIDKAMERRSKPSVWQVVGTDCALLLGNLLANRALQLAAAEGTRIWLHALSCYDRVNQAQLKEYVTRHDHNRTIGDYTSVVKGKTSAMLELAVIFGSSMSEFEQHALDLMIRAMGELGLAFQIVDDMDDLRHWLTFERTTRSKTGIHDLDAGIYTLPAILLLATDREIRSTLQTGSGSMEDRTRHDPKLWEAPLAECTSRVAGHIDNAINILRSGAPTRPAPELLRLRRWLGNIRENLRGSPLDSAILEAMRRGDGQYNSGHD